jgi:hypothetical protein
MMAGEGIPWKKLTRANVEQHVPCFGHFSAETHCTNMGFRKLERNASGILYQTKCPLEALCKKKSLEYMRVCSPYVLGQIDKPREIIRRLEK